MNSCIFKNLTYSNIWLSFILILPPNLTKPVLYCVSILIPFVVGETLQHILLKLLRAPLRLIITSWLTEQDWPVSNLPTSAGKEGLWASPPFSLKPWVSYHSWLLPKLSEILSPNSYIPLSYLFVNFSLVLFSFPQNSIESLKAGEVNICLIDGQWVAQNN